MPVALGLAFETWNFAIHRQYSRREWVKIAQDEILGKQPIKPLRPVGAQRNL